MIPVFHNGDKITIKKLMYMPSVNDIILYDYNGVLVVHRVIDIDEEYIVTKGDNSDLITKVNKNNVLGVVNIND